MKQINKPDNRRKLGVYIHIPFCRQKCLYCDFPSCADAEPLYYDYTTALCREIAGRGGILSAGKIDTVYIGGGTPTILPDDCLLRIIDCLRSHGRIEAGAEFTVEANPGTLDSEKLAMLRACGVNRLSIGVQAFDDKLLGRAGRIHSADMAIAAVEQAAACGFDNISIDLMYGLPGQTIANFRDSLRRAAMLPVRHISAYGLKIEEGTPFAASLAAGRLELPDEAEEDAMYEAAVSFLPSQAFRRYEISNYAKAGAECRHNLKYWQYQPYLGLGAAAHSFLNKERSANTADVGEYIKRVTNGELPVESRETPEIAVAMAEYAFLALRTTLGLSFADFTGEFGMGFLVQYGKNLDRLAAQGLVAVDADSVRLTERGMKYGNIVFASFLPE